MTQLTDNDDVDDYYNDAYNGLYGAGAGGSGTRASTPSSTTRRQSNRKVDVDRRKCGQDLAEGGGDDNQAALQTVALEPVPTTSDLTEANDTSQDDVDREFDNMISTAMAIDDGSSAPVARSGDNGNSGGNIGEIQSFSGEGSSLEPVVDPTATVYFDNALDDGRDIVNDDEMKGLPIGSQDSLNRLYPIEEEDQNAKGLGSLDVLADLGKGAEDIVYDDIDEAMRLANNARGVANDTNAVNSLADSSPGENLLDREMMIRESRSSSPSDADGMATDNRGHDILNDISKAVEHKRMLDFLERDRKSPVVAEPAFATNEIKEDHGNNVTTTRGENHIDLLEELEEWDPTKSSQSDVDEEGGPSDEDDDSITNEILGQISKVASSVRSPYETSTTPSPVLRADSYVPIMGGTTTTNNQRNVISPHPSSPPLDPPASDDGDNDYTISRPWKEKWADPYANNKDGAKNRSSPRVVSPITFQAFESDGSNYDPDSDWDVDDVEEVQDFGCPEEAFEDSTMAKKARGCGPMRIW